MICPYCLTSTSNKTRDHIIPDQFGTFSKGEPITIPACERCNEQLGRELEDLMAADSWEAFIRFRRNESGKFRGRHFRLRRAIVRANEDSRWDGSIDGWDRWQGDAVLRKQPQLGLPTANGYDWILLRDLKKMPDGSLSDKYCPDDEIRIAGSESEHVTILSELARLGIDFKRKGEFEAPTGDILQIFEVDHFHQRAMAKIAFNYLNALLGIDTAIGRAFDEVRAYIRHGTRPPQQMVRVLDAPPRDYNEPRLPWACQHSLCLSMCKSDLVAHVVLYNDSFYRVRLARNYPGNTGILPIGHVYNLNTREVTRASQSTIESLLLMKAVQPIDRWETRNLAREK